MKKWKKAFLYALISAAVIATALKYHRVQTRREAARLDEDRRRLAGMVAKVNADQETRRAEAARQPHVKVLVTPFENGGVARSLVALSLGIPAHVAERLEGDPNVEPINGELVLTEEQARLVGPDGRNFDLAAANALALARGATHFLAGRYYGQVWTWTFEVSVYAVGVSEPTLVGKGASSGDITDLVKTLTGRKVRTTSAERMFAMMGSAVEQAFRASENPLAAATVAAIAKPPTADAFAFLKLSRAYVRHFGRTFRNGVNDTAIGLAKVAQMVDPAQAEAQRFYAALCLKNDLPKMARIHYEFAIDARPDDVRSLVQLGKLELDADNPDIAAGYLKRATAARPGDGDTFYWYAVALIRLNKADLAISALETARTVQWWHVDARKELAKQYANRHRYREAAAELETVDRRIMVRDPEVVYLQAACLRAADDREAARQVLADAARRFPRESRMHKFRADLLQVDGLLDEARREYRAAARLAPGDARLKHALSNARGSAPLGGESLLAAITAAADGAKRTESARAGYQLAINDAIADMHDNGEQACTDGRAPSSGLLAQAMFKEHVTVGGRFVNTASRISRALRDGEGSALTPDEVVAAGDVIKGAAVSVADTREMIGLFRYVFAPLFKKLKCDDYDGPVTPATVESVRRRNADRQVTLPEIVSPDSPMAFSPRIEPDQGRVIRFVVDNAQGEKEQVLTVDGKEAGTVLPGREMTFSARLGYHRICLLPKGTACGPVSTLRVPFLSEGWTIRVRPAK